MDQQPTNPTTEPQASPKKTGLTGLIGKVLRYVVPVGVSAGLILWLFHKVDIHEVVNIIRHGCDFRWIAMMMLLTMLSHIIRGIRWGIQLRGVGIPRIPVIAESVSIFGAYALNLLFPYLGEAWRCVYISRREKAPLSTVVGTDLGDRASDAIVVAVLLVLTLILAHPIMDKFFIHYGVDRDIRHWVEDPRIWIAVAIVGGIIWTTLYFSKGHKYFQSFKDNVMKIWDGFKVLFHMKGIDLYIVLTLGIWICYYLETYSCFYAFPFTRQLIEQPGTAYGLIPGLVVFVFGSFSIAVPSNGGLGPWNLAVMFALSLYGIPETEGTAYSITVWGCQALMLVALGIFSACYIMTERRRNAQSATEETAS
ncbi:MAG: flippase-like domain-containing protein [Muribaculum sp.]|nr:flippase-like domain-containing protein [Muribaculum sp.]